MGVSFRQEGARDPISYARTALDNECHELATTGRGRNEAVNKCGFSLGQLIPGGYLGRAEVESRVMAAAEASGYLGKDGPAAARASMRSGIEAGMRQPRDLGQGEAPRATVHVLRPKPQLTGVDLPAWTEPGEDGKPKLIGIGQPEPRPFDDEVRRHVYRRDGEAVRVKTKNRDGRFTNWFRVRRSTDDAVGWQARKPSDWIDVPYLANGAPNPFDPERRGEMVAWPEGEKDVDTLAARRWLAFTFGGTSDCPDLAGLLEGHHLVILADNDEPGEKAVARKVDAAILAGAASIKVVRFPDLPEGGDVSDYYERGGSDGGVLDRAERIDPAAWKAEQEAGASAKQGRVDNGSGFGGPPNDLDHLNAEFCVVLDTGKARVLHFETVRQEKHSRKVACFLSFEDFRNFHMNRYVEVGDKKVSLGHWWLRHPDRRQYRGLTFEPAAEREINGRLNLWRGWGVEPAAGDWSLMRRHIVEVLASGNAAHADYITKWMAWTVQHPAQRAEAALVFKGARGTGKGTLGNTLCQIFGQHGTHISTAEHLAGRFNGHLRDACFLFADEAYWPGDKGAEGSLKRLVTEPDLFIEAKGRDGVTVPNMLHIMMASNDDWVVPAGEDERRYAVFAVSDCYKQDAKWFGPLNAQMEAGGCAAMLQDLLHMDLGSWHPRRVIRTEALVEQQSRGLGPEDAWWCELLQTGVLYGADPRHPSAAVSNGWEEKEEGFTGTRIVKRKGLYDQAREVSPRLKGVSDHMLARALTEFGCSNDHRVMRRRGWHFPLLADARRIWESRFPGWKWRTPDLVEWHREAED